MTPTRPTPALAALTAVGVGIALVLGGCSLLPSIPTPGGDSSDRQSDGDDSSNDAGSDSGADEDNEFASTSMPENFPDDIPTAELELLIAIDLGTGWTIAYRTDDAVAEFDALADEFASGGWEELSRETSGDQGFAAYDSPEYQVQLNAATDNTGFDTPVLSMTVVRKD